MNIVAVSDHVFHSFLLISCSKCLKPCFTVCVFYLFSWLSHAQVMIQCTAPYLVHCYTLIIETLVLLTVPLLTLTQWAGRSAHHKSLAELWKTFSLPSAAYNNGWPKSILNISTLGNALGAINNRFSVIESKFELLASRVLAIETGAASGSPSGSWPLPGQVGGSTATGSRGPSSMDEKRNMRRKLVNDIGSEENENARSAALLQLSCEDCHSGVSAWLRKYIEPDEWPERLHCKYTSKSARLVFETRAKCQAFVTKFKNGLQYTVDRPHCNSDTCAILVRQSTSPEWREFGRRYAPFW